MPSEEMRGGPRRCGRSVPHRAMAPLGWLIGLRFVVRDGYPVLAELRAFPDEGTDA